MEELWLGKNKISKLQVRYFTCHILALTNCQGLDGLKRLKILSIQSNRITKLEGLENLESLEELYISHNGITRLEGIEKNVSLSFKGINSYLTHERQTNLRTLDIGNNFIEKLENVSHLSNLEELWVSVVKPHYASRY